MRRLRAGVIGHTGRGDYGHGLDTVYLDMEEVDVVAVADADPQGLGDAGERLGIPESGQYTDYRVMVRESELDLVSVATRWPDQHLDMVLEAVKAGVQGIYCEKPMARTLREADAILDACERSGTKIAVAHQLRFHPLIRRAKELIADGLIGEVKEVFGTPKQDQRGGGQDLMVLGTHILDLMCFVLDAHPRWVQGYVLQDGRDVGPQDARDGDEEIGLIAGDHLQATYAFPGDRVAYLFSRRGDARFGSRSMGMQFCGTEGILAFRDNTLLHYPHPCWTPAPVEPGWDVIEGPKKMAGKELNHLLVRDLVGAIKDDREPIASGQAARWALEMILGVYAAHRFGRTHLPMAERGHPLEA